MKSLIQKMQKNEFLFATLFLAAGILPVLLKGLLTGSIGPTFEFYFIVLWIPAVALSFSCFRGQKEVIFTSLLLISAFIISFISYPLEPIMDFRRQIVQQLKVWVILAVMVSFGFQIIVSSLKNKRGH